MANKPDSSRARRFVWEDGDVVITPPPPGDTTEEDYKDVDWAALENDDEGKQTPDLGELAKRFNEVAKKRD